MIKLPILEPLPILTKGLPWYKRTYRWLFGSRKWRVKEDFIFKFRGYKILIPKGFITDFASIPKFFRPLLSPVGILMVPGLLHDFYYKYHYLLITNEKGTFKLYVNRGKFFGDKIFKDVAKQINGMFVPNIVATVALEAFGWPAWWRHRKNNAVIN